MAVNPIICGDGFFTDGEKEPGRDIQVVTLRDLFAAAALAGMIAATSGNQYEYPDGDYLANLAYFYAEDMLAEREK